MELFDRAFQIAVSTHFGQKDRYGEPYILHPVRMMLQFADEKLRIIALLHDVIEDGDWSLKELRNQGFSEDILSAVVSLTRRSDEAYEDYIVRVAENPLAVQVKLADLEDNMNLTRIDTITGKDLERLQRYHRAWIFLKNLPKGNRKSKG